MKTINVVYKEPNKPAEQRTVEIEKNLLNTMQKLVGGGHNVDVQHVPIGPGVTILVDEDGLAKNLPDNCGFVGNIVFVQDVFISEDEGYDWGSLDEETARKALRWCFRHTDDVHPDRSGTVRILTNEEEIKQYRASVAAMNRAKVVEWRSL